MRKTAFISICCLFFCSICNAVTRIAVIPVSFNDIDFTTETTSLASLCSNAEKYFNDSFHGQENFELILLGTRKVEKTYSYYGANSESTKDKLFFEAVQEACVKADRDTDFSRIAHIFFITAGKSEADGFGENWFWPQQAFFPSGISLVLDGRKFTSYGICSELGSDGNISGHGTMCHEICHLLGMPDLYDTDGERSGGKGRALNGDLSIMDQGDKTEGGKNPPLLGAVELDFLGRGVRLDATLGPVTLKPVEDNGHFYMIEIADKEYFLAENRRHRGLEIYYINKSDKDAGYSDYFKTTLTATRRWACNEINCNPDYQCATVVNDEALPSGTRDWFDFGISLAFSDIRREESGNISFNIVNPVSVTRIDTSQEDATIYWASDFPAEKLESFTLEMNGRTISGEYGSFTIGGLKAGTSYSGLISVRRRDGSEFQCKCAFCTKPLYSGTLPFIYIPAGVRRTSSGAIEKQQTVNLSIFNNPGGEVSWYFNGKSIDRPAQFTITQSGTISAVIRIEDGSHTIIRKAITVE